MKVILLKDVRKVGKAYTEVEVSDGYAINFLFPKKVASRVSPEMTKKAESMQKQVQEQREMGEKMVQARLTALADEKVVFVRKANDKGHLYDGVDAKEIAEKAQLPEDAIRIERAFKELGIFEVPVSVGESFGKFEIEIQAE